MEHRYRVVVAELGPDRPGRSLAAPARALRDAGLEVIDAGRAPSPSSVAAAAVQEDADAVVVALDVALAPADDTPLPALADALRAEGREDAVVVGLGLAVAPAGADAAFAPDTPIDTITDWLVAALGRREERLEALA